MKRIAKRDKKWMLPVLIQNRTIPIRISAASFCRQAAAWVPVIFCNFYFVKNHKIVNDSKITKARENTSADLESREFLEKF